MTRPALLDGIAGRFVLVLAAALIVANIVAGSLLLVDRVRQVEAVRFEREVERIVSLVPALEAAAPDRRAQAARAASTRLTRLSIDRDPRVERMPVAPRSRQLTQTLRDALDDRDVRAAILIRQGDADQRAGGTVILSIQMRGAEGLWLNSVSRGDRRAAPGLPTEVLFLTLVVSLIAVLGVALLFVRRLTRPLNALSAAARAAGRGDRQVRVAEDGPREIREAASAFNQMQEQIARFDAERMRTLAAIGHDLRTPMTSLRIRMEMLDEDQADPMIRTLEEMTVMADGLVAYGRGATDGEMQTRVLLTDLLHRLCTDSDIALRVPDMPVAVTGRPVALTRVFRNILDNARRYAKAPRVCLRRDGDRARVTIEDDGPGIPPALLGSVMDPFVRGDPSRSTETGGAGLGLSIARDIVTAHGGELVLENRDQGGLCVTVTLPVAP